MIKRVPNKPFDVGAWLNEFFFVSGDQKSSGTANYSVICVNQVITVKLQWLEYLWDYENMFQTGVIRASECLL